jgi:uncharacterized Zn-binding protein involved in type VI secretion
MISYAVTNSSTNHGGTVLADQSLGLANGLGWLTVGVSFFCPQCKEWAVFQFGDPSTTVNGKSVLLVGANANCGAVLLPAQSLFGKGELKSIALKENSVQS